MNRRGWLAAMLGEFPNADCIAAALSKVDWRCVKTSAREVRLDGGGTAITLNGIAQGFAADRALEALRRHGIGHALVDTGEIGPLGAKDAGPWTAGIQHPRDPNAYLWLAPLDGRYLSTSGDYATRFSEDYAWNHLFDPHTGRSPQQFASISVVAPSAAEADAWSTAFSVMTLDESRAVLAGLRSVDALFVLKDASDRNHSSQSRRAFSVCYMDASTRDLEDPSRSYPILFGQNPLTL